MDKKQSFIQKNIDSVFSLFFKNVLCSEPMAKSFRPVSQREPEMPQEILDTID